MSNIEVNDPLNYLCTKYLLDSNFKIEVVDEELTKLYIYDKYMLNYVSLRKEFMSELYALYSNISLYIDAYSDYTGTELTISIDLYT